jgi:hypothetical protein
VQLETGAEVELLATGVASEEDPRHTFWQGSFAEPGTHYILVRATTVENAQYLLNIGGAGLALTWPVIEPAPVATIVEPQHPLPTSTYAQVHLQPMLSFAR